MKMAKFAHLSYINGLIKSTDSPKRLAILFLEDY